VTVTENTSSSERTATITVKGGGITRTVSITQEGGKLEVSPTSLSFTSSSGSKDFKISSNVSWTVSSDKSWCTVSKSSGSNNATITVKVTENTSTISSRSATITIKGGGITKTVSVTQDKKREDDTYLGRDDYDTDTNLNNK
jgi:carbon monoxide dehydrogenase subunit G